jgi:RNA polymerase sigma factor (sigma-70 family)
MGLFNNSDSTSRIIHAIQSGEDDKALELLYQQALPKIKSFILKNAGKIEDVQDIFQDAIIVLYRYVKAGKYNENQEVAGFLYGVCKNLFYTQIKKSKKIDFNTDDVEISEDSPNQLHKLISGEKQRMIETVMDELGERCKELLTYTIFDKKSMKEIAQIMSFANEDTAKTANYKCKQRLSKLILNKKGCLELLRN